MFYIKKGLAIILCILLEKIFLWMFGWHHLNDMEEKYLLNFIVLFYYVLLAGVIIKTENNTDEIIKNQCEDSELWSYGMISMYENMVMAGCAMVLIIMQQIIKHIENKIGMENIKHRLEVIFQCLCLYCWVMMFYFSLAMLYWGYKERLLPCEFDQSINLFQCFIELYSIYYIPKTLISAILIYKSIS